MAIRQSAMDTPMVRFIYEASRGIAVSLRLVSNMVAFAGYCIVLIINGRYSLSLLYSFP